MRRPAPLFLTSLLVLLSLVAQAQNSVLDWNAVAANTVIGAAKKPPGVSGIYLTYVQLAVYDAVSAIDKRYAQYGPTFVAPAGASLDAAVISAAHRTLVGLLPTLFGTQPSLIPGQQVLLDNAYASQIAGIPDSQAKLDGIAVGEQAATNILTLRSADGRENPSVVFVFGPPNPGVWQSVPVGNPPGFPPPLAPWVGQMLPFTMTAADQFLPDEGPTPLFSPEWALDYNQTRLFGAKVGSLRTPEQTDIGLFWSDHTTAQYSRAFRQLAADQGLTTSDSARLLAMLMTAQSDAFIGCMNAKYHFAFWRPYTAIRNGETDGNAKTDADTAWIPLAPTPPHPEYPAAHGCVTSAAAEVLTDFFGTGKVHFTVDSVIPGLTHPVRQFDSLNDLVREVGDARIYGGMHYHHSVVQGGILGRKVAKQLLKNYFKPL